MIIKPIILNSITFEKPFQEFISVMARLYQISSDMTINKNK
ncbi:hypothetical protein MTBPR1_140002 [Candidatus Terasakiella magnetica]|uniref:Uncharacterized protein n=1 Tax=Candidatus Terasakiella magnetica TaxID=1867952 RepID=A0A1C3RF96_9PROT|nr:hypothetical protein MTBPR1_140002 [Candidatus Terasakiella magnetica]